MLARSYAKALGFKGHQVTITTTAQDAVNASDQTTPDLIILELQLANHNGIEFLYEFRSYPEWQNIPVIVLSMVPPSEFKDNLVLWQEIRIEQYLYKPQTSLSRIIDCVENLVVEPA